jgi:guanylate kinase
MAAAGEFAEWAEVHGNLYGTAIETLQTCCREGIDIILDIDCQGARQLKERHAGGIYVFILPPDLDELRRRLDRRNSDAADVIERRLRIAAAEIKESRWYDYIIVNDNFRTAVEELKSVVLAEKCRTERVLPLVAGKFGI